VTVRAKLPGVLSMFLGACAALAQPPEAGRRVFMQAVPGPPPRIGSSRGKLFLTSPPSSVLTEGW